MRLLTPLALAALVAGCTVGPDFQPPPPPAATSYGTGETAHSARIGEAWWALFRSSELDAVVKDALAGNRDLAAARATLTKAAFQAKAAGGTLWPQLDLTAAANRDRVNLAGYGFPGAPTVITLYQVGPTISYDLDLFGKAHRQIEAADAQTEAEGYQLGAATLTLTGDVVAQAVAIASLRAQLQAVDDIVADDEKNLALVREAKAAGSATEVDVLHADSQLANDRTLAPPLRQRLSVARHALALLLGRTPASWSPPDFALDSFHLPEHPPVSLPSALVHQRPDIMAAEANLHGASAAIGIATAARYPDLSLSANLLEQAAYPGALFHSAATAGGGVLAPLFHGGALEAQQAATEAAFEASEARYQQTVLRAFTQVADVLQALTHDADEEEAQQKAVATAQTSLHLTRLSYAAGNVGVLQVLDAQRQYQQARLGAVHAQAQRILDTAQLLLAMGGGWGEKAD